MIGINTLSSIINIHGKLNIIWAINTSYLEAIQSYIINLNYY